MAQTTIRTIGGQLLDDICHRHYNGQAGATEAVLTANPGLSKHGPVLPAGVDIVLPVLPAKVVNRISLWD